MQSSSLQCSNARATAMMPSSSTRSPQRTNVIAVYVIIILCLYFVYVTSNFEKIITLVRPPESTAINEPPTVEVDKVSSSSVLIKPAWPNPALVVGFPKAGTQSISDYFECGCYNVTHYRCGKDKVEDVFCGKVIKENVLKGVDPLFNTGNADIYGELEITSEEKYDVAGRLGVCYYPQIDALEELHQHHPNSPLILNTRNASNWLASVSRWHNLRRRFINCNLTGLPTGVGAKDEDMISFFNNHIERIRNFCKKYPSHKCVEVDVESKMAGEHLETFFGISAAKCWGKNDHRKETDIWRRRHCLES